MRLSDVVGTEVVDGGGRRLGKVIDVRLAGPNLEVEGLVVGPSELGGRLGFLYGDVRGPALLARLVRRLMRGTCVVPWSAARFDEGVVVAGRTEDLPAERGG